MRIIALTLAALFCLSAKADIAIERSSDEVLMAEAEKLVREDKPAVTAAGAAAATAAVTAPAESTEATGGEKILKESEIPVFTTAKKTAKSESSLIWRLVASLGLIGIVALGLIFAGKRWTAKKNVGGEKTRIEVLHQVHFGPKKTLSLVRVAGEVILLGMTDQSISMLKSVVLIDEELENTMNTDFNKFLDDDFAVEDVRRAISSRA